MTMWTDANENNVQVRPRSLLTKYEIPTEHLSYEYIGSCTDSKELERIVKILRSGEEGHFPELQRAAEDSLRRVSPSNRLLRGEEPALTRHSLSRQEWGVIASDLTAWKTEMAVREANLPGESSGSEDLGPSAKVRKISYSTVENKPADSKVKVTRVSDYAAWDKYDADTELLRMDLEEEQKKDQEKARPKEVTEKDRLEEIVRSAEKLSVVEKQIVAEQEKNRGNEFYQAKDYVEAEKHYTASIAVWPTAKAYNNRAACSLKQCKFSAALEDADETLKIEPDNVKALFRRGLARQQKNMFKEALQDMNEVLRHQPDHLLAQHHANELRTERDSQPSRVRVLRECSMKVEEITKDEFYETSKPGTSYEVNEWGLPKVMCQCTGNKKSGSSSVGHPQGSKWWVGASPCRKSPRMHTITELTEEATAPETSTRIEVVEVETRDSEEIERPLKTAVVDRRFSKTFCLKELRGLYD